MTLERDILNKLRSIDDRLARLEKRTQKRNISFEACIPPTYLCKEIINTSLGNFDNQMRLLADYYGIIPMGNYHNPEKVPKNAIACYHSFDDAAYYKELKSDNSVVLHEFFHHLHAQGVVNLKGKNEEPLADKFAKIVIERGTT